MNPDPSVSGRWEVQFQDIVIEQKIAITKSLYIVVDTNYYCTALKTLLVEYTVVNL